MSDFANSFGQRVGAPIADWRVPPPPSWATLTGVYCRVEPLDPDKHGKFLHQANAADVKGVNWTYLPYGPFGSFDQYDGWIREACRKEDPQFYAVVDERTGLPGGVASYLRIKPESGTIEVGHIHFSPLLQRTPASTEAIYLLLRNAFSLGYRRCEWKCDSLNAASRASAARLGFSFEGIFRQATVYKNRNRDSAWYAVIDSDWPRLQDALSRWLDPSNFDHEGRQLSSLSHLTRPVISLGS